MKRVWVWVFLFFTVPVVLPPTVWGQGPEVDTGTTAWMLTSTALVLLMIPGLAMFYGGLVRTKNVLGTMMHCFAAMAIVGVLWVVCGYSMSFGPNVLGGVVRLGQPLPFPERNRRHHHGGTDTRVRVRHVSGQSLPSSRQP